MSRVLCLNASYEPLRVVSWRDAVCLLLEGKAEIIEEREGAIRSPSVVLPFPSVIRLLRYVSIPFRKHRNPISRRAVLRRDDKTCAYCLKEADTVDHVIPRAKGGLHTWTNVVAACRRCNQRKGSRLLSELGWELQFQPYEPESERWLLSGILGDEWADYLVAAA